LFSGYLFWKQGIKLEGMNQAIRRIRAGHRPNMPVCILLADHWDINPNELLMLAGWPALKAFDIHTKSAAHRLTEAVEAAKEITRIPNPGDEENGGGSNFDVSEKVF
jgi:hypothetical protein